MLFVGRAAHDWLSMCDGGRRRPNDGRWQRKSAVCKIGETCSNRKYKSVIERRPAQCEVYDDCPKDAHRSI